MSDTPAARPDVTTDAIVITVRGVEYRFRIPSIRFDIEVGYRAAKIRAAASPESGGALGNLDFSAANFARHCAVMEMYLSGAGAEWPYSVGPDGKPTVDSSRFPVNKRNTVWEIGQAFEAEYARFCDDGPADGQPAGAQAVAGVENPGA